MLLEVFLACSKVNASVFPGAQKWELLVDKAIFFKYKNQLFKPPLALNTKSPGTYPSQLSPETPGLEFPESLQKEGLCQPHGAPATEGHKGVLWLSRAPTNLITGNAQGTTSEAENRDQRSYNQTGRHGSFSISAIIQNTLF